ncbi:TPA: hypothetical protein N0F65_004870 [Lagenidium giganteum]|uniref:SWIM-type domain-containing protein n=1 Tax=Lagenidium giganteum TaxID=4803 RepID=A0AAV2ZA80_9STRA|nr:TPA: hypothetical protein N0F65_004870 [Lagenidium giganteum]
MGESNDLAEKECDGDDAVGQSAGEVCSGSTAAPSVDADERKPAHGMRRPCNVHVLDEHVIMSALKTYHRSWAEFRDYFKEYQSTTFQVLKIYETVNCELRNKRIDDMKWAGTDAAPYVPLEWQKYERKFACTHGIKPRSRGVQVRPHQMVRYTGCPFHLTVQLVKDASDSGFDQQWCLEVKNACYEHNHMVAKEAFLRLTRSSNIKDRDTMIRAQAMIQGGSKRSLIYDFLLESNENMGKRDVDNLIYRAKSRGKGTTDDVAVAEIVARFLVEDENNAATIDESSSGHTAVISLKSRHMREMFARFPELILVDCTHKTNRYNYQLCTIMVVDEFGHGQVVQHSVLDTNSNWHMERVLAHFLRVNDCVQKTEIVMVDKALNEIKVIERSMPQVKVLICLFHVLKYLSKECKDLKYGKLSSEDQDALLDLVHAMVYATSKEDYYDRFFEYFMKNWDSSPYSWAKHTRQYLPHFMVDTNNALESFFGKLKDETTSHGDMRALRVALIKHARQDENEYVHLRGKRGMRRNTTFDDEMNYVQQWTTHYEGDRIAEQYQQASELYTSFKFEPDVDPAFVIVKFKSETLKVGVQSLSCTCPFASAMKLPCKHVIAYRKHLNEAHIVPIDMIDVRWRFCNVQINAVPFAYNDCPVSKAPEEELAGASKPDADPWLTKAERYKEACRVTTPINEALASITNKREFEAFAAQLRGQWQSILKRKLEVESSAAGPASCRCGRRTQCARAAAPAVAPRAG